MTGRFWKLENGKDITILLLKSITFYTLFLAIKYSRNKYIYILQCFMS